MKSDYSLQEMLEKYKDDFEPDQIYHLFWLPSQRKNEQQAREQTDMQMTQPIKLFLRLFGLVLIVLGLVIDFFVVRVALMSVFILVLIVHQQLSYKS